MGGLLTVSSHALTREQLLQYAKTASEIRRAIAHRAQHFVDDADQREVVIPTRTRSRREQAIAAADARNYPDAHKSVNPVSLTRKRRKMRELSAETRLQIVKAALSKCELRRDIAIKFNVKQ